MSKPYQSQAEEFERFLGAQIGWLYAFSRGLTDHAPEAASALLSHLDGPFGWSQTLSVIQCKNKEDAGRE